MRLTNHRHGLFLFFMLAFALVGFRVPVAQAAPGNGAIVIDDQECTVYDDGSTFCFGAKGVSNQTITPSGNTIFIGDVQLFYRVTDEYGNVVQEWSDESRVHALTMDGFLQVLSARGRITHTWGGGTCTNSLVFHLVNGQVQFARSDFSCS